MEQIAESIKEVKEKSTKKIIQPPKSPKLGKVKIKSNLVNKLKLNKKTAISSELPETKNLAGSSKQSSTDNNKSLDSGERVTSGEGTFVITKSASDTNLQNNEPIRKHKDQEGTQERTKSLENLINMPAYGDLILDASMVMSNATQSVNKATKDHLYKILVIGDLGTGKTSIIKRYVHRFFTQHYRATIGVDFALKALTWDDHTVIRLQLWDIAGQERYGNMTRVYYKEAVGAFIVFDVTRRSTLESVANWKSDLDSKVQLPDGSSIPCVLLANKCDQAKEGFVTDSIKMDKYCTQNGFTAWFETSARDNINIDEAAKALVEKILWYDSLLDSETKKQGDQFALTRDTNESINSGSNKSCSC